MQTIFRFLYFYSFSLVLTICFTNTQAKTFTLPAQGDVVGQLEVTVAKKGDSFAQIARDHDLGYVELAEANPDVDPNNVTPGTVLVVPNQFLLPNAPKEGLVINLAEMRLYYYPDNTGTVVTYPIGIGREGEDTPVSTMKIIEHVQNPTWTPTETMRKLRAEEGVTLPKSMPPGPDNPMGKYKMRLSSPTYLIHGTNDPLGGIGRRSSSGCMRLYPEDIEKLFHMVPNGTNVHIVNEPYKTGWLGDKLYIESHISLDERNQGESDVDAIKKLVSQEVGGRPIQIAWNKVMEVAGETQGWPQVVGELAK